MGLVKTAVVQHHPVKQINAQRGRSFYTGSMGYLGLDGKMDLNILIRSMLLDNDTISFRTGAGIVADSDPDMEVSETQHKARGLLRALGDMDA